MVKEEEGVEDECSRSHVEARSPEKGQRRRSFVEKEMFSTFTFLTLSSTTFQQHFLFLTLRNKLIIILLFLILKS